ncbi:Sjogren's syndrome/scleroderma autoantigen 1 family protein [Vulcanisaeta distributa]|uniref:Sjogrens syndrome scleroderma autoantigen 1 n=1 Tax=Vulcanisaeta distributa (strain DSM 14429 / JCM 11212 / NBRC 100878 / IC-017) TaxID=572478 RepID=E1QRB7_VULDI|nr:Sjogren's syndrome/scleroderma autoantigen 1 family protein [Vulcanisaeta distributa]ADN50614.1 Sjogrens syndrome scleroderma autoantigen 1 [Vulcanisaeta distributa DSM 14429]
MSVSSRDLVAKKMAQLIRAGATLTSYTCPVCGTPLLRLKTGEYYCANCDRPVVIVRSDAEEKEVMIRYGLMDIRDTLYERLVMINNELKETKDIDRINELVKSMVLILEAYDKITQIINQGSPKSEITKAEKK